MAGNPAGGRKTRDINLAKDPDYYVKLGRLGGKTPKTKPHGFMVNRELASRVGAIGGAKSRRNWDPEAEKQKRIEAAEKKRASTQSARLSKKYGNVQA